MAAPDLRGLIQVGFDILTTTVDATTKKILAQLGNVHKETTDSNNAEWWQHVGFASRPPKPVAGKVAAQAATLRAGNHDVVFASQDLRGLALYGQLDFGETCVYAPGEDGNAQGRIVIKKDGSVSLYTREGNTESGAGMLLQLDPANGAVRMINHNGVALILDEDGATITTGAASLRLGVDGSARLTGTGPAQVDGTSIVLGSTAVPGANSVLVGVSGVAGVPSTKVFAAIG